VLTVSSMKYNTC